MWPDNETTSDLLGFQVHVDLIRSVVTDRSLLPVTVGLFADWGGGKTSIMRMLERDLDSAPSGGNIEQDDKVVCLYFNGWLFEGYDDAKAAILSSILIALGEHKRFGPRIRDRVASLLGSVNWMRATRLGLQHIAGPAIAAFATGGSSIIPTFAASAAGFLGFHKREHAQKESKEIQEDSVDWGGLIEANDTSEGPLDVRTFRDRFSALLEDAGIDTLIVLIDDLDRCSPDRIVDNLEAIKLFLNVEHTAFVIGADPRIVRHAIRQRYAQVSKASEADGKEAEQQLTTDYLEKLIQVPYFVPKLSPAEIETYMNLLFCQRYLNDESFARCLASCRDERERNRYSTFGLAAVRSAAGTLSDEVQAALRLCSTAAPLVTEGLKGNPRQVKRFLNALVLRKKLAAVAKLADIRDDVLVKLMVLEYAAPERFAELFSWQLKQEGHAKELAELEALVCEGGATPPDIESSHGQWLAPLLRRWLVSEPRLSSIDLRDYFWIARDKLSSTLTGLSLVPPVVRRLYEDLLSTVTMRRRTAATTAKSLLEEERVILLQLSRQHLVRRPEDKVSFDALRVLVEADVPGAVDVLSDVLIQIPLDNVPAAVGAELRTMMSKSQSLKPKLAKVVDRLTASSTRVGKAFVSSK